MKLTHEDLQTEDMDDRDGSDHFESGKQYLIEVEEYEEKVWFWKEKKFRLFAREVEGNLEIKEIPYKPDEEKIEEDKEVQ